MAASDKNSAQWPLMRVNQQKIQPNSNPPQQGKSFRMQLHSFVPNPLNESNPTPNVSNTTSSTPSNHNAQPPAPAYKQVAFKTAKIRGVGFPNGRLESKGSDRKRRRTTKLTAFRPLQKSSDMHADAWNIILAHTRPSFVMQMRKLNKFFYHLTNSDVIWKKAREHHYGYDMPPCPSFLTERQYAELLDGRGCQNPSCERRETRKARWVFRVRLCDECLSQKVGIYKIETGTSPQSLYASMFDNIVEREQCGKSLFDLLPTSSVWSGKVTSPRSVLKDVHRWSFSAPFAAPLSYLKSDHAKLEAEFQKIVSEGWEPQRVFEWVKEKHDAAIHIAITASKLEVWDPRSHTYHYTAESVRLQREEYFTQRASQLEPPIYPDVLECFAAYQSALASPNPPSERSWQTLLNKILPYRALAEEVAKHPKPRYSRFAMHFSRAHESDVYSRLHKHRNTHHLDTGKWQPEQRFVLDLAEAEYAALANRVADEDLLLLCLRNVYNSYQQITEKPKGLNFDGTVGEYRLSLDDAKLVVEEVIENHITKSTVQWSKVLESLQCMGCTRYPTGRRYPFQEGFEHILEKHSRMVGQDLHFHRFLRTSRSLPEFFGMCFPFPWYLVEWTKSLPFLPTHAQVTSDTRWIPDENVPYQRLREPDQVSVFEHKQAVPTNGISPDDVEANFVHAIKTFLETRLDSDHTVKIAIKYSLDLYSTIHEDIPSLDTFLNCIKAAQKLRGGLQFKFRCGACTHRAHVSNHTRCVKYTVDVDVLQKHWNDKHRHEQLEWVVDFAALPSDAALSEAIIQHDDKLRQDQARSVERENVVIKQQIRKLPNQKAGALMHKETAVQALENLFVATS